MKTVFLCSLLLVQLSIAVNLRADPPRKGEKMPVAPPSGTLEPGFQYAYGPGSGCTNQPEWAKDPNLPHDIAASKFQGLEGWNGFCQVGLTACPDAVKNQDYMYYAKTLGDKWAKKHGWVDKDYCAWNGFLDKEYRRNVHNFTWLQNKSAELCATTFDSWTYEKDTLHLNTGIWDAWLSGFEGVATIDASMLALMSRWSRRFGMPLFKLGEITEVLAWVTDPGTWVMNQKAAQVAAAYNCVMGDLGCDIAYCNYAYCKKDGMYSKDDGVGPVLIELRATDECEGWDPVKGMPDY